MRQFDPPSTRAAVASPKSSGCSCCCCCCIATLVTSGALTARAIGRVPPRKRGADLALPPPALVMPPASDATSSEAVAAATAPLDWPGQAKAAADKVASAPATATANPADAPALIVPRRSMVGWRILGFFLLPLVIGASLAAGVGHPAFGAVVFVAGYIGALFGLRHSVGLHGGWIIGLLVGLPAAVALEVFLWFALIFK